MSIKLKSHGHLFVVCVSVKRKLCSGLKNTWGLLDLFILIFARFEFESAVYCNFFYF